MKIAFADLTHTGTVIDANNFPLGVAYVAAAAKAAFLNDIAASLFKYPEAFAAYLDHTRPDVLAMSNYMWNERLSLAFAKAVKARYPETVVVFGGPNYPIVADEQVAWLRARPEIDFYIDGEGETAFVAFLRGLLAIGGKGAALKKSRTVLPNLHYVAGDDFVQGPLSPRMVDLDAELPSPYLEGLMDGFFDGKLTPLVQTTRGCPYSCTFCHDGIPYMTKTRRFSQARIDTELEYIQARVGVPALTLADLNWGLYPEDIDTAHTLARLKKVGQWPRMVSTATAKNHPGRVAEIARILGDSMYVGASIQSTDKEVLGNIKRGNIGVDKIVTMAKAAKLARTASFTEIILCLPGDTLTKHRRSVADMMNAGIEDVHSYQFILLPGTEGATAQSRERFNYETRFRVLPRCFGRYRIFGEEVPVAERHEVCVGNSTMPHQDYLDSRWFDLTLAIFNNGSLVEEVLRLVDVLGARRSELIASVHDLATAQGHALRSLYDAFRADEDLSFWPTEAALSAFVDTPAGFDAYMSGARGTNQIYRYRVEAVCTKLATVVETVVTAARQLLASQLAADPRLDQYLDQLTDLILARRADPTDIERLIRLELDFDVDAMEQSAWLDDPRDHWLDHPSEVVVSHDAERRVLLDQYFTQYGKSLEGLIYFFHRNPPQVLHRAVTTAPMDMVVPDGGTKVSWALARVR